MQPEASASTQKLLTNLKRNAAGVPCKESSRNTFRDWGRWRPQSRAKPFLGEPELRQHAVTADVVSERCISCLSGRSAAVIYLDLFSKNDVEPSSQTLLVRRECSKTPCDTPLSLRFSSPSSSQSSRCDTSHPLKIAVEVLNSLPSKATDLIRSIVLARK